jgi:hypothetical protein
MGSIYIAASPLQLLNCIEAKQHFKDKNTVLLLVIGACKNTRSQMNELIGLDYWNTIIRIRLPVGYYQKLIFVKYVDKILNDIKEKEFHRAFVGDIRNIYIRHIFNSISAFSKFSVDDGMPTVSLNTNISESSFKILFFRLFLYKTQITNLSFFTIFNLTGSTFIKNEYHFLKNKLKKPVYDKEWIFFIGQPLVELGIVSKDKYIKNLRLIIDLNVGKKFTYILHRRQNYEEMKEISNIVGFKLLSFKNLIEIEMVKMGVIPYKLLTYYSAAIVTLPIIFKDINYQVIKVDSDTNYNMREINAYFSYFNKTKASVIELNE